MIDPKPLRMADFEQKPTLILPETSAAIDLLECYAISCFDWQLWFALRK
jgi:hypothetical protein